VIPHERTDDAEILMIVFTANRRDGRHRALIFNNQLSVMQGQLSEMQAERRPWISIEVTGHSGIVAYRQAGVRRAY
jgi:hypothetical protein